MALSHTSNVRVLTSADSLYGLSGGVSQFTSIQLKVKPLFLPVAYNGTVLLMISSSNEPESLFWFRGAKHVTLAKEVTLS